MGPILRDLPAKAMRESVHEPTFVNIRITRVRPSLVLQDTPEAMENLILCEDLPLVNVVLVLLDGDKLKFKSVRSVDGRLGDVLAVVDEVEWLCLEVLAYPILLHWEEFDWHRPLLKEIVLISILTKAVLHFLLVFRMFLGQLFRSWLRHLEIPNDL